MKDDHDFTHLHDQPFRPGLAGYRGEYSPGVPVLKTEFHRREIETLNEPQWGRENDRVYTKRKKKWRPAEDSGVQLISENNSSDASTHVPEQPREESALLVTIYDLQTGTR